MTPAQVRDMKNELFRTYPSVQRLLLEGHSVYTINLAINIVLEQVAKEMETTNG